MIPTNSTSELNMTEPPGVAARIADCPVCQYSWDGLPDAGRCPECGLEFDERSRSWIQPKSSVYLLILTFEAAALVLVLIFVLGSNVRMMSLFIAMFIAVSIVGTSIGALIGHYKKLRARLFVLTDGIVICGGPFDSTQVVNWPDVRRAYKTKRWAGHCLIIETTSWGVMHRLAWVRGDAADEIVRAIHAHAPHLDSGQPA